MDVLNLSLKTEQMAQAAPIAGQQNADTNCASPGAAFGDALLNMINMLAAGQGKAIREPGVDEQQNLQNADVAAGSLLNAKTSRTLPGSILTGLADDDDEASADSLLKGDAQHQLLQTLLNTSQTPIPTLNAIHIMPTINETLTGAIAQPQTLSMELLPSSAHQGQAAAPQGLPAVESMLNVQTGVSPALMTTMTPVTPTPLTTHSTAAPAQPAHTTTMTLDPDSSRWTQQLQSALGERLQVQVKEQLQHATIRLDPPEMGKIDISMQIDNGRVQVQINASHAEVYRALQQTSNDLRQSLTEQNFVQVNVQVSSQSGGQQQQGKGQQFAAQHDAIQAGAEMAATTLASTGRHEDGSVLLTV